MISWLLLLLHSCSWFLVKRWLYMRNAEKSRSFGHKSLCPSRIVYFFPLRSTFTARTGYCQFLRKLSHMRKWVSCPDLCSNPLLSTHFSKQIFHLKIISIFYWKQFQSWHQLKGFCCNSARRIFITIKARWAPPLEINPRIWVILCGGWWWQ